MANNEPDHWSEAMKYFPALAGSVSYALLHDGLPWRRTFPIVFAGWGAAVFLAPMVVVNMNITSTEMISGIGYLMGLCGVIISQVILKVVEVSLPKAAQNYLDRWLGKVEKPIVAASTEEKT